MTLIIMFGYFDRCSYTERVRRIGDEQMEIREKAQAQIHDLYNDLMQREQTPALIDITDVLLQVYKKLDTVKNPEVWVNRLVKRLTDCYTLLILIGQIT